MKYIDVGSVGLKIIFFITVARWVLDDTPAKKSGLDDTPAKKSGLHFLGIDPLILQY